MWSRRGSFKSESNVKTFLVLISREEDLQEKYSPRRVGSFYYRRIPVNDEDKDSRRCVRRGRPMALETFWK